MKKTFRLKACAGILGISALALSVTNVAFAATNYIRVGSEDIYVTTSKKSNAAGTATYTSSIKTLNLNNYSGSDIVTNVPNIKVTCGTSSNVVFTTNTSAATTPVTISASICTPKDEPVKNPETVDSIYYYLAILVVSSTILATRRHFAKR